MLTIGQLASYAGVTVRAVRHYHAKGLLTEPDRDHSGYRRYSAGAVVELIKVRTLAEAGVPLSRVRELLVANEAELAAAVADIDRRLRAEITERRRHRERIAHLAAGDSLALPQEAVDYLDRMRKLGFAERFVDGERDAWILVAAQLPEQMPLYMSLKQEQLDDPEALAFYREVAEAVSWAPDDPRLEVLCDRLVALLDDDVGGDGYEGPPRELAALLDSMFLELVPVAPRILQLLEERGWRGWTHLERISGSEARRR